MLPNLFQLSGEFHIRLEKCCWPALRSLERGPKNVPSTIHNPSVRFKGETLLHFYARRTFLNWFIRIPNLKFLE